MKNKIIYLILIFLVSLAFATNLFANENGQKKVILNPKASTYIEPYKITNLTNKKLFAPYTDLSNNILWNSLDIKKSSKPSNSHWFKWIFNIGGTNYSIKNIWKKFWDKLPTSYTKWWFKIENITYKWVAWKYWSCNSWTKIRSISCKIENTSIVSSIKWACDWLLKPSATTSEWCWIPATTTVQCSSLEPTYVECNAIIIMRDDMKDWKCYSWLSKCIDPYTESHADAMSVPSVNDWIGCAPSRVNAREHSSMSVSAMLVLYRTFSDYS